MATGWAGGDHVLDLSVDLAKNIVDDALHLAIRIDTDKIPSALLRAYTQIEIDALAQGNPSGVATKAQRQEAKETASSGPRPRPPTAGSAASAITRSSGTARPNTLYAGSTSTGVLERLLGLFRETFDRDLEPITAGSIAQALSADPTGDAGLLAASFESGRFTTGSRALKRALDPGLVGRRPDRPRLPRQRVPGLDLALAPEFRRHDPARRQLGSERDPRQDPDARLPARRNRPRPACRRPADPAAGSPPRTSGRQAAAAVGDDPRAPGAQYELTMQAESFAVSGAALPKPEGGPLSPSESRIARLESLRHLAETIDLLFAAYLDRRTSSVWSEELGRIRGWLQAA